MNLLFRRLRGASRSNSQNHYRRSDGEPSHDAAPFEGGHCDEDWSRDGKKDTKGEQSIPLGFHALYPKGVPSWNLCAEGRKIGARKTIDLRATGRRPLRQLSSTSWRWPYLLEERSLRCFAWSGGVRHRRPSTIRPALGCCSPVVAKSSPATTMHHRRVTSCPLTLPKCQYDKSLRNLTNGGHESENWPT